MGITFFTLKALGNVPVIKEVLIMSLRGFEKPDFKSFKTLRGMLFGKTALLTFKLLI